MGRRRLRTARTLLALAALAAGASLPGAAAADLPALSREVRTDGYVLEPGELEAIPALRGVAFAFGAGPFLGGEAIIHVRLP